MIALVFGRLLLRLLLVPLGAAFAVCISVLVLIIAHWGAFLVALNAQPDISEDQVFALVAAGPFLLFLLVRSGVLILLPAIVGIAIAEVFAIRSWIYHAGNGALSAWIGWSVTPQLDDTYRLYGDPKFIVAAGLAAGLAYWLVAGWTSGFWKPTARAATS
jgi:hypothetical protein